MVHRRPVYIYFLNVPSFSSRYFNKIKRTSRLGRLLALSLEILTSSTLGTGWYFNILLNYQPYIRTWLVIEYTAEYTARDQYTAVHYDKRDCTE